MKQVPFLGMGVRRIKDLCIGVYCILQTVKARWKVKGSDAKADWELSRDGNWLEKERKLKFCIYNMEVWLNDSLLGMKWASSLSTVPTLCASGFLFCKITISSCVFSLDSFENIVLKYAYKGLFHFSLNKCKDSTSSIVLWSVLSISTALTLV